MTTNLYTQTRTCKFLAYNELEYFIKEVCAELKRSNVSTLNRHEKALFSWYLREYCFLPFSAITKSLSWAKSANCRESVLRTQNRSINNGSWPMIHPETRGVLGKIAEIASELEVGYSCLSDTVLIEDEEHLLWCASQVCGFVDKRSSPGCRATPKYSQLQLIDEMLELIDVEYSGDNIYTISEKYLIQPI